MGDSLNWCLIESDPGLFTALIDGFGVTGLRFEEVYDLSEVKNSPFSKVHGLIFLFKYDEKIRSSGKVETDFEANSVFFAQQTIQNACATFAILSILLNLDEGSVDLGNTLKELKSFASALPADMRGLAISNSDVIRNMHNSFARSDSFLSDPEREKNSDQGSDPFHFIAFVPHNNTLYELDGLMSGPINHGNIPPGSSWLELARTVLESRIASYGPEIRFNLMTLVEDPLPAHEARLSHLTASGASGSSNEKAELEKLIYAEKSKRESQHMENVLRKHHFIPLVFQTLFQLSKTGLLDTAISKSKTLRKRTLD